MRAALTLDTCAMLEAITEHLTATQKTRSKAEQTKLAAVAYSLGEAAAVLKLAGVNGIDVPLERVVRRVEFKTD